MFARPIAQRAHSSPIDASAFTAFHGSHEEFDLSKEKIERPNLRATNQHSEVVKPPSEVGNFLTFLNLKAGIVAGLGASLALSAAAIAVAGTYIGNLGTWSMPITWAAMFALSLSKYVLLLKKMSEDSIISEPEQFDRVNNIVRKLCAKTGMAEPELRENKVPGMFFMVDRKLAGNIMSYCPESTKDLSDRELQGILAHELSHADRGWTIMRRVCDLAKSVAVNGTLLVAMSCIWNSFEGSLLFKTLGFGAGLAGGIVISSALGIGAGLLTNIASRSNEILTDLRAVLLTGDAEGLHSGLGKICNDAWKKFPNWFRVFKPLLSHPSYEIRARAISNLFRKESVEDTRDEEEFTGVAAPKFEVTDDLKIQFKPLQGIVIIASKNCPIDLSLRVEEVGNIGIIKVERGSLPILQRLFQVSRSELESTCSEAAKGSYKRIVFQEETTGTRLN